MAARDLFRCRRDAGSVQRGAGGGEKVRPEKNLDVLTDPKPQPKQSGEFTLRSCPQLVEGCSGLGKQVQFLLCSAPVRVDLPRIYASFKRSCSCSRGQAGLRQT